MAVFMFCFIDQIVCLSAARIATRLIATKPGFFPSPCTASPCPFACRRHVHNVCSASPFLWPAPHSSVLSTAPIEQVTNVSTRATPCVRTHPSTVQSASGHFFPARAQLFRNAAHSRPHARRRLDSVVSNIVQFSRKGRPSYRFSNSDNSR